MENSRLDGKLNNGTKSICRQRKAEFMQDKNQKALNKAFERGQRLFCFNAPVFCQWANEHGWQQNFCQWRRGKNCLPQYGQVKALAFDKDVFLSFDIREKGLVRSGFDFTTGETTRNKIGTKCCLKERIRHDFVNTAISKS